MEDRASTAFKVIFPADAKIRIERIDGTVTDFRTTSGDVARPRLSARRLLFVTLVGLTIGTYITLAGVSAVNTHNRVGLGGAPLFYDFSVFYQAGLLADGGRAVDAYDDGKMIAAQRAAFPGSTLRLPWNYPPTFQVMLMPFGALPYIPAWLIWTCALYGFYALLARRLVHDPDKLWILLLAPGAAVNLFFGQNGILSVVLMGAGVLLLRSRPVLAGVMLGMMAYKPQFALLVPLALLFGREWRAFAAATISQAALIALSVTLIGMEPWLAFLHKIAQPSAIFASSSSDWRAIPSVMIFARSLGFGAEASSFCHWTVAALAAVGALWIWHKTEDGPIRAAVLAAATVLVTPYLRAYDLVLLVLPIAVLLSRNQTNLIEKTAILAAWLIPAILMFSPPRIQFGPLVSLALFVVILWRTFSASGEPNATRAVGQ
ncbi:MAG TPA: glycosyltransferase family 87 protein [Rhizomicrobium sp.]|nr:glycosyltransferase family 87 protein [Rhizomicrobium sp.]